MVKESGSEMNKKKLTYGEKFGYGASALFSYALFTTTALTALDYYLISGPSEWSYENIYDAGLATFAGSGVYLALIVHTLNKPTRINTKRKLNLLERIFVKEFSGEVIEKKETGRGIFRKDVTERGIFCEDVTLYTIINQKRIVRGAFKGHNHSLNIGDKVKTYSKRSGKYVLDYGNDLVYKQLLEYVKI